MEGGAASRIRPRERERERERERASLPRSRRRCSLQLSDVLSPRSAFLKALKQGDNQDATMLGSPCPPQPPSWDSNPLQAQKAPAAAYLPLPRSLFTPPSGAPWGLWSRPSLACCLVQPGLGSPPE